ncbi:hypothetical protein YC2023_076366 [Brassica napus]
MNFSSKVLWKMASMMQIFVSIFKKDKPNEMSQFRPNGLCNVSYTIISKVLYKD